MSRITEEMKLVPRTVWAIAALGYIGAAAGAWWATYEAPWWAKMWLVGVVPLFFVTWVLLIGYVNRDARRRGMRHVMWTLLAIFIPNAIGIILYFILRTPLMKDCGQCGRPMSGEFAFCPNCGAETAQSCPSCKRAIEPGWSHCPGCGKGLRAA